MDDEYILVVRAPALTDRELIDLMRAIRDFDNGDMQVVVVPDELRKQALKILEEF